MKCQISEILLSIFPVQFHMLEELITPIIQRENTNYRDCISVGTSITGMN